MIVKRSLYFLDCAGKLTVAHISRANNIETNCAQFTVVLADCNWEMVVCNYRPRAQLQTTRRAQLQNQATRPGFATKLEEFAIGEISFPACKYM